MSNSPYVLVHYRDNWADEMDVYGLRVMTRAAYESWRKALRKKKTFPRTVYVGTNEDIDYDDALSYEQTLTVVDITQEEAETLSRLLKRQAMDKGGFTYGIFKDPAEY